jgi:hypothetical protein
MAPITGFKPTGSKQETNRILSLRPSSGLPTFILSLCLCFGDALPLPFEHHLALELGHRGKHVEH